MPKKVREIFAGSEKVTTFATAIERGNDLDSKNGFLKVLKKSFQIFWWFEKLVLPLQPLSPKNEGRVLKRFEKKSLKNLAKRFGGYKKRFYLCTTFRFEKSGQNREVERPTEPKTKMFL